jgi:hypothetical protein
MIANIIFHHKTPPGEPRWTYPSAIVELSVKYLKITEGLIEGYAGIGRKL